MKIYNYQTGEKAVFINNEKTVITENAALLIEHFGGLLQTILEEEHGITMPNFVQASDENLLKAANSVNYTVKAAIVPNNNKEVVALYKNGEPFKMLFNGKEWDATNEAVRKQLSQLFNN